MKQKIVILILAAISFGILAFFILPPRSTRAEVIQYVFSDQQTYDRVASSTNATARLLHLRELAPGGDLTNDYVFDPLVRLSSEQARQIEDLALAPSSYNFRMEMNCIPDYGVLFAFNSGTQAVCIAICFKCNQLGAFTGDGNNIKSIGDGYIRPSRNKFLAIAKSIFTNAPEIQSFQNR